jgi:hypothetical protein
MMFMVKCSTLTPKNEPEVCLHRADMWCYFALSRNTKQHNPLRFTQNNIKNDSLRNSWLYSKP